MLVDIVSLISNHWQFSRRSMVRASMWDQYRGRPCRRPWIASPEATLNTHTRTVTSRTVQQEGRYHLSSLRAATKTSHYPENVVHVTYIHIYIAILFTNCVYVCVSVYLHDVSKCVIHQSQISLHRGNGCSRSLRKRCALRLR